jgi:hypothetical protein
VPALLEEAREIDGETLAAQMQRRLCLTMWVSLRDIPTRSKYCGHAADISPNMYLKYDPDVKFFSPQAFV